MLRDAYVIPEIIGERFGLGTDISRGYFTLTQPASDKPIALAAFKNRLYVFGYFPFRKYYVLLYMFFHRQFCSLKVGISTAGASIGSNFYFFIYMLRFRPGYSLMAKGRAFFLGLPLKLDFSLLPIEGSSQDVNLRCEFFYLFL